jgi:hypothetical protein
LKTRSVSGLFWRPKKNAPWNSDKNWTS